MPVLDGFCLGARQLAPFAHGHEVSPDMTTRHVKITLTGYDSTAFTEHVTAPELAFLTRLQAESQRAADKAGGYSGSLQFEFLDEEPCTALEWNDTTEQIETCTLAGLHTEHHGDRTGFTWRTGKSRKKRAA